jgi:hypothetical protein
LNSLPSLFSIPAAPTSFFTNNTGLPKNARQQNAALRKEHRWRVLTFVAWWQASVRILNRAVVAKALGAIDRNMEQRARRADDITFFPKVDSTTARGIDLGSKSRSSFTSPEAF